MTGPLLETKFHVPRRRRGVIDRPRLRARLHRAIESPLTLVSAPAGFGKSTLVTEWLATDPSVGGTTDPSVGGASAAWLSLDARDNDTLRFWRYLIAAVGRAAPGVGDQAAALLQAAEPIDEVLGVLLNDLGSMPHDVVLVLDDYHVIEALDLQEAMAFLLEHLPPQLHVVLTCRADPALPLARLRARGELVEVRAADLRFTPDEAAAYLNDVMGLSLADQQVATLEGRTEGWIAALQLAALSLQGRDDVAGFIDEFAGDDRYIVDYLVGEVLDAQPDDVRAFLLQTSILGRLTGSLCDAVTGLDGGRARLEALERANLLVIPLDDRRRWYRYHHLFADVLRGRLLDETPGAVDDLHRRAADWYARHDEPAEAIRHAMAADDFERAADLIERAAPRLHQERREATVRAWIDALPDEVFHDRPVLCITFVSARMSTGDTAGVEHRLDDAQRWVDAAVAGGGPPAGMVVVDQDAWRALPVAIEMYRAGLAHLHGDVAATMAHARRALDLVEDEGRYEQGAAASLLGLAHWSVGDLDEAYRWFHQGMDALERAGWHVDVVGGAITLADIRIAQGRLGDAMALYEQGLRRAADMALPVVRGTADLHVGMAEVCCERNDLEAARRHLDAGAELGDPAELPQNPYRRRVVGARLRQCEGDFAGAVALLDEAEQAYDSDYSPRVRPVPAIRARVHLAQGDVDAALRWARQSGVSIDDELSYVREYEHLTLARVLIAQHRADRSGPAGEDAARLLDRLLEAARQGGRRGRALQALLLLALVHQARGDLRTAVTTLDEALREAAPAGYVRLFLDEGPEMASLLRRAIDHGDAADLARRVLESDRSTGGAPGPRPQPQPGLVEPLSERELDVLRLLRSDLDGPAIARELTVSLNTMRTHTKRIYTKLGVTSRRAAVRRADELGL